MKKLINPYYFALGIMFLFFAFGHAYYGQANVMNQTKGFGVNDELYAIIFQSWHLATSANVIFGVFLLFMSSVKDQSSVLVTAWLILVLNVFRLIVFLGSMAMIYPMGLKGTIPQIMTMLLVVFLLVKGIKKTQPSH